MADLLEELGGIPASRVRMHPTPGTATEADVVIACRSGPFCELIDGTLVEKPIGILESFLASLMLQFVGPFVRLNRLGLTNAPDGMYRMIHGNIREPDVSFTSRKRVPNPMPQVGGWCPDLCMEILSPSNTPKEMSRKRTEYFDAGCRLVWEIDFRKRTVLVYNSVDSHTRLADADTFDGGDVLPGFTLSLAELFAAFDDGMQTSP